MKSWFHRSSPEDILIASSLEPLGPIAWNVLRQNFSSLEKVYTTNESDLRSSGLTPSQVYCLTHRPKTALGQLRLLKKLDIKLITIDDSHFPDLLREIPDPPLWIYTITDNDIDFSKSISVVGTRKPTRIALTSLELLFPPQLLKQLTTVSGLAYGIDAAVHRASLSAGGKTVAVLAGGLDDIYPSEHASLAKKILDSGGALLSEYPPLVRPKPYRFPVRNRIIAGLSPATVIVEAEIRSGTMTTAKSAIDYNRDIFVVPSDITRKPAEGNLRLLDSGAIPLTQALTLFDYFGLVETRPSREIDSSDQKILDLMTDEPLTVEQISYRSKQPIEKLLVILTGLELQKVVSQPKFGYYQRTYDKETYNRRKPS